MATTCNCFLPGVLLYIHCLLICMVISTTNITTIDQSALLAFKTQIISDPSLNIAKNWSIETSVCEWIGVTCDPKNRRVSSLNLSNMGLVGTIPQQLGNLSFLVSIDMRNNYFRGELPEEMRRLRRLRYVYLNRNNFTGEIPGWFDVFSDLQHMNLRGNSFTGSLPLSLFNLSKLELLDLSLNKLIGNIPKEIQGLASLEELYLWENNFIGVIPSEIGNLGNLKALSIRNIGNLTKLERLGLANNNLYGAIPNEIGNIYGLTYLSIPRNNLMGPIPVSLFNMSKLEVISFWNNSLSGTLPDSMCSHLPNLGFLYLDRNNLHGQIPSSLDKCILLEELTLETNRFSGTIPRTIGNPTMLRTLYLRHNNLRGFVPEELSNLQKLEELYLGFNNLSGLVPFGIFNISTIRFFSLVANNFIGNLPSNMGFGLPNLEQLYIGNNSFTGVIPMSISNCSKLSHLDLGLNGFLGTIPNSLGDLRYLKQLRLFQNNLTSEFSSLGGLSIIISLTNCRFLQFMSIDDNPLDGLLPISIGNFSSSIEGIYLSSCKIKGRIPESIGNLSNLISLDLSNNYLTGSIPTSLLGLKKMQGLLLPENDINGIISNNLCDLKSLTVLNLTRNQISGPIPECLGNIASLRRLLLSFNRFNSSLPTSLWNLKDLLDLQLGSNNLNGFLSPDVGNLRAVTSLDLSKNQLWGTIPSAIRNLQSLYKVSLAYNNLEGQIPESISDLLSVELLDLSHNRLTGSIPTSIEALTSLKHFNVSFNDLSGEIPFSGPFRNFTWESFISNKALCGEARFDVPKCKKTSHSRTVKVVWLAIIVLGVVIGITMTLVFFFFRGKKKGKVSREPTYLPFTYERISHYELIQATNRFHESNLLGSGSFGSVYKGTLNNGMVVAVKLFHANESSKSFNVECEVLRFLRHRNLTKVITSCSTPDLLALVLEFVPNGNLEKWLYSHNFFLDTMQRLKIMIDVACALQYLHNGCSTPIVHCDLKPSNVLIDQDLVARVTDFGIAKLLEYGDQSTAIKGTLATFGYVAPEYGSEGLVSTRSDIYSFGIMLMEVFTRTKPSDEMFKEDLSMKSWVLESMPNKFVQVIDANLLSPSENYFEKELECVSSIMEVALNCTTDSPRDRMKIDDVFATLNKIQLRLSLCYNSA